MESPFDKRRAAAWVKLAQAMAYADEESLPIEEKASLGYASTVFLLSDDELSAGRALAVDWSLSDAIEQVDQETESIRAAFFRGMVLIAWADGKIREPEKVLLAALATRWKLGEEQIEAECVLARQLATTIHGEVVDAE